MDFLDVLLIISILTCSLVTGFIFTYAIVVMPGLSRLTDKEFIRAFKVTDEIIQKNQPLFMIAWIGSVISVLITMFSSIIITELAETFFVVLIGTFYLLGVQGITISIHLPLNKHIQNLNIDELSHQKLSEERTKFEKKWNFFNKIRTTIAFAICLMFLVVLALR